MPVQLSEGEGERPPNTPRMYPGSAEAAFLRQARALTTNLEFFVKKSTEQQAFPDYDQNRPSRFIPTTMKISGSSYSASRRNVSGSQSIIQDMICLYDLTRYQKSCYHNILIRHLCIRNHVAVEEQTIWSDNSWGWMTKFRAAYQA